MRNRPKGSVLVQVLVLALLIAVLAGGITRMLLLNSRLNARMSEGIDGIKYDEQALALVTSYWNNTGQFCATPSAADLTANPEAYGCVLAAADDCLCSSQPGTPLLRSRNCGGGRFKICVCSLGQAVRRGRRGRYLVTLCPCACP